MASTEYIKWLGLLEERVAATSCSTAFALPSPANTVQSDAARLTEGVAGVAHRRTKVTAKQNVMKSSGIALTQAKRQLAASQERPKSQGWQDWGSAPLFVEYSDVANKNKSGGWAKVVVPSLSSRGRSAGGGGGQAVIGTNDTVSPPVAWRPPGSSKSSGSGSKPETNYAPPTQRLSKLEVARQQAADALVLSERQRAAEVSENAAWLSHLDDEIYRAKAQLHASYKGEYTVTLTHAGQSGFGMTLETGRDGVTRVTAVGRHGSAAAAGVVVGSEVVAVAGCTLERGQVLCWEDTRFHADLTLPLIIVLQGQDGLIPVTAICGVASVEFRFRRPDAAAKTAIWREFDEYAVMRPGEVLLTIEYSAGHLHARYEWAAAQVRDAVVKNFPGIRVLPKPLDTHAPKHRQRVGAFELQLAWLSLDPEGANASCQLTRSLLFSKLQTNLFPHLPRLLAKLRKLQDQGCWQPFAPTVQPAVGISRAPPHMAADIPVAALARSEKSASASEPTPAQQPTDEHSDDINCAFANNDDLEVNGGTSSRRRSLDPFEDTCEF